MKILFFNISLDLIIENRSRESSSFPAHGRVVLTVLVYIVLYTGMVHSQTHTSHRIKSIFSLVFGQAGSSCFGLRGLKT